MKNIIKKIISSEFNNGRDIIMGWCWAMPTAWTFKIPYVKELLDKYMGNCKRWADLFAGMNSPAEFTNDLNPALPVQHHMNAMDYVDILPDSLNGVLWDPPYSIHQIKVSYQNFGVKSSLPDDPTGTFVSVKDKLANKIIVGGYVISFGWNHTGFGMNRGFEKVEILDIDHGGGHNCTCVAVEIKVHDNYTYKL
jgi:hypothetical protein